MIIFSNINQFNFLLLEKYIEWSKNYVIAYLNPDTMAKGMNSKKADKKEPAKTAKEKKLEKKDKKPGYQ
jgi:hypothetical protein